jgi:hypothetical protein
MTPLRIAAAGLCLAFTALQAQAASYFVQPIVIVSPGAFINGLEIDGATSRTEGYFNAPTAVSTSVDLEAGTIRGIVSLGGGGVPSGGASQGRFGEQVTFQNADDTTVNLRFTFEGSVYAPARDPNLNSLMQIGIDAYIAVFDPAVGATASTWFNKSFGNEGDQTIFKDRITLNYNNPTEILDDILIETLVAPINVTSSRRSFDIFVNLTLNNVPNFNPGPVTLDFLNTASLSIEADPGVTYTSLSGTFLDSTGVTVVPAPGALPLLGSGLAVVAGFRARRRRKVGTAT